MSGTLSLCATFPFSPEATHGAGRFLEAARRYPLVLCAAATLAILLPTDIDPSPNSASFAALSALAVPLLAGATMAGRGHVRSALLAHGSVLIKKD